jgi:hypothetical protein
MSGSFEFAVPHTASVVSTPDRPRSTPYTVAIQRDHRARRRRAWRSIDQRTHAAASAMPRTSATTPNQSRAAKPRYSMRCGVFICRMTGAVTIIASPPVTSTTETTANTALAKARAP